MGRRTYVMGHWAQARARAQWPMATLSYVLWPCPMSDGPVLCLMALSYALRPVICPMPCHIPYALPYVVLVSSPAALCNWHMFYYVLAVLLAGTEGGRSRM